MKNPICPKCDALHVVKSGVIGDRQRYRCKKCGYYFTVNKVGKNIDSYYVTKALQLYIEGISYREIERILGVSHVSVMNWVRKYNIKAPAQAVYHPTYKVMNQAELVEYIKNGGNLKGAGMMITELGDKYMMIKWKRFKE